MSDKASRRLCLPSRAGSPPAAGNWPRGRNTPSCGTTLHRSMQCKVIVIVIIIVVILIILITIIIIIIIIVIIVIIVI